MEFNDKEFINNKIKETNKQNVNNILYYIKKVIKNKFLLGMN